jgi:hypothetical protein
MGVLLEGGAHRWMTSQVFAIESKPDSSLGKNNFTSVVGIFRKTL